MFSWDNDGKQGRVTSIMGDVAHIRTSRGGEFTCHNEGFKIGDSIQYLTDSLGRRLIAVRKKPDPSIDPLTEFLDSLTPPNDEEEFDESDSNGQVDPWDSDWFGGIPGNVTFQTDRGADSALEYIPFPVGIED